MTEEEIATEEKTEMWIRRDVETAREALPSNLAYLKRMESELTDDSAYRAYVARKLAEGKEIAETP